MTSSKLVSLYEKYLIEQDSTEIGIALAILKAACLDNIIEVASGETKDSMSANKYLLEFSYKDKKHTSVSKPQDDTILKEAYELYSEYSK